jgi:hypothetical protein
LTHGGNFFIQPVLLGFNDNLHGIGNFFAGELQNPLRQSISSRLHSGLFSKQSELKATEVIVDVIQVNQVNSEQANKPKP